MFSSRGPTAHAGDRQTDTVTDAEYLLHSAYKHNIKFTFFPSFMDDGLTPTPELHLS